MKNLLLIAVILFPAVIFSKPKLPPNSPKSGGNTYYVSPNGSDNNNGSFNAPFGSWSKLSDVLVAGDVAYIRGGTYYSQAGDDAWQHCSWENLNGTATDSISILAYPGELPVLDLSNFVPAINDPTAVRLKNSNYVHIKGLRITGLKQNPSGEGISRGFSVEYSSNNTIELIELDHIGGYGFMLGSGSNDNLFLNCDAHHLDDRYTNDWSAWGNANGFQCTGGSNATRNTFDGCRAWWISDDGFDLYGTNGIFYFKNCWSFWNGYEPGTFNQVGDGDGFKMGPENSGNTHNSILRTYEKCLAFENAGSGFDQNNGDMRYKLYNNTTYGNGSYGYMFDYISPAPVQDLKNNASFLDANVRRGNETNGSFNSWNLPSALTSSDFLSISSAGMDGPRQADGSLPRLNFLRPSAGSKLLNAGTNVGLPFSGSAPEIGAFEVEAVTPNQPPVANAGANQSLQLPLSVVTLQGSGTDSDGTIVGYQWAKISGPASGSFLASSNSAQTNLTSIIAGIFQYELTVTDNNGATGKDTVTITLLAATNIPPVASAGQDQSIILPINSTTLSGTGSDADGTVVSFNWSQVSGPSAATINNPGNVETEVSNLISGVYIFRLKVTDNNGATASDDAVVTVANAPNQVPIANAGPDQTITLPVSSVTLSGSGSDPDGSISSYSWVKTSGPAGAGIVNNFLATTVVNGLVQGVYMFELTVTDNSGASATDLVKVTVNPQGNMPPLADAGPDMTFSLPTNSITLTGTGTDPDGNVASTKWRKLTGPAGPTIQNSNWPTTNVNGFVAGIFTYEFRVTDNNNAVARDTMQIIVLPANQAPVANAGEDQDITLPQNSTSLSGSGVDADGEIVSFQWTQVSGPSSATIESENQQVTSVSNLVEGQYIFKLTVTDDRNGTDTDQVLVTVHPHPNQAPTVNAGGNITITLPQNAVTLNGTANDSDGTLTNIEWTQVSGPATATINSPGSLATGIQDLVSGIYEFLLTVTDDAGASASSLVQVTVNNAIPVPNIPPVANAGPDISITLPVNQSQIAGSGSDADGSIISYTWRKISGPGSPIISNPNSATCIVSALSQGTFRFELKVVDNQNATSRDTMVLTVLPAPNVLPTANAGNDITLTLPVNSTTLNGNGTDPDGYIVSYLWQKLSGPAGGSITNPTNRITTISGLTEGNYSYKLTVTDNRGGSSWDTLTVTVLPKPNQPPVVFAGSPQTITLPISTTTLSASASDNDGSIVSILWSQVSGPSIASISSPGSLSTAINGLIVGDYIFQILVTDDDGATASDNITIHVQPAPNQRPVAYAGPNQTIQLPADYGQLQGTGYDPDGYIVSYLWRLISGPTGGAITNPNDSSTLIVALSPGVYNYELTVFDNAGATGKDTVWVTIVDAPNQPPTVSAGPDKQLTLPQNSVALSGTATDSDGYITGYNWLQISGPATATVSGINQPTLHVSGLVQGTYRFIFSAWDNDLAVGRDTVQILVIAEPQNQPPVVSAGPDKSTTLPINSMQVSGSASDPDGSVAAVLWSQASGPSAATMTNTNTLQVTISNLVPGQYYFVLRATDNAGAIARDTMMVTVNPAPNIRPVANAGPDQVVTLPANSITAFGSGTDADGTIVSYLWEKISGGTATIASPALAVTAIQALQEGAYYFKLTVRDNSGAQASDTMKITVLPAPNLPPVANAGPDQVITLPVNTTTLSGSGTDSDGTIVSYSWEKISGGTATIASPALAVTAIQALQEGTYYFKLTVRDNGGAQASDTMKITVLPAPNLPPVVNAGPDQVITLPVTSVTLNGSGQDPDGEVVSYQWLQIQGPSNVMPLGNEAIITVTALEPGIYLFKLLVTDNAGSTGADTVTVTVNPAVNLPPVADAGQSKVIILPQDSIQITGFGYDPDGEIVTYAWEILSTHTFTAAGTHTQILSLSGLQEGSYSLVLTVTDNRGATATDTTLLQVLPNPRNNSKGKPQLFVLGNPFTNQLNLKIDWNGQTDCQGVIYLYDIKGSKFIETPVSAGGGSQVYFMNTAKLVPGTYVLGFKSSCSENIIKKLIKL